MDYLAYYDLERYLFDHVGPSFNTHGEIGAFDSFSIIVWKANRAKSMTARRLLELGHTQNLNDLDAICRAITGALFRAPTDEHRLKLLLDAWGFRLPMASAILTVLYPDRFTVYDYRVCGEIDPSGELGFKHLADKGNTRVVQIGYRQFIDSVREVQAAQHLDTLRDTDRYLVAKSMARDLSRAIQRDFARSDDAAAGERAASGRPGTTAEAVPDTHCSIDREF